ncbi:MAG: NTP/NDP exchange transporter [Polyangiales bacterium]
MSSAQQHGADERSTLERALGLVTEVRAGEGITALLLCLNVFLLLLAYYLIKPVRDALIVAMPSGPEYKSYMGGVIAIALLFAVPAYSRFAQKVPRNRLVVGVTLFFASNLVLFYGLSLVPAAREWIGLVFTVWVGIFNMMVVAQAWAFAADLYTEEQGRRLFPLVGVGASFGSAVGSLAGVGFAESVGVYFMLLLSALFLLGVAGVVQVVHKREEARTLAEESEGSVDATLPQDAQESAKVEPPSRDGAFALVFRHRYLTLIAVFSLVFTIVNSNGEYLLGKYIKAFAEDTAERGELPAGMGLADFISAQFSEFYLYVNIAGALLQLFVVSRLVKSFGFRVAFLILPVIAFLDATMMSVIPALVILRIGKTVENSLDYSLNNTLRNMLWLPTTKDMKYRAKQAVDTFFIRMGDVGSAILVAGLIGYAELGLRTFAAVSAVLALVWLAVAWALLKEREARLQSAGGAL